MNGEPLLSFENEFSNYVGSKFCIGVGSGLDALQILLLAYGIGEGDEVIVPGHTFIATWLAVLKVGAKPVAVDVCERTYNLDSQKVNNAISDKTKAIIAVHLYGLPCDMSELSAVAKKHKTLLFEDAAQSHGAYYRSKRTGNLADGAAWSFYPAKNLGALADAGAITINNETIANKARELRNYGFCEPYNAETLAFNSRLDNLQSALLSVKLEHLENWNIKRRKLAEIYFKRLSKLSQIKLPTSANLEDQVWHQYVIRTKERTKLQQHLKKHGIQTQIHYPLACHKQAASAGSKLEFLDTLKTELLANELLSLPISPEHEESEIEFVSQTILAYFSH